ncbi:MAG TPA: GNAT family N-acetyltransferase [Solirubrobacterales bacterium]|jgi:GNAT superfamily N-acetyltransferase|nr:GNAT family N-acetyltransferase [Solirubrobacterales bacterium]
MSEPTATVPATVRPAAEGDVAAVALAVEELLLELGGRKPAREELEAEIRAALEDPGVGAILVAESGAAIVGVLSASWQRALHVPGRYATIQDLWVDREWRSRRVGAALVEELVALCGKQGVARIEVGLPRESFDAIGATEAFYRGNGFERLGPRMRRLVS